MAARIPRRSFATPFVVTLAGTAACYVQSAPPQGPPPSQPPPTQTAQPNPDQPPPPVMVNPPPPTTQPTNPQHPGHPPTKQPPVVATNPPTTTQGPATPATPSSPPAQAKETKWTVYKAQNGTGCMAAIKVQCVPKATCNPPPPFKYACPDNVSLEKPITIATYDGTSCFVEFEAPKCPPNTACNPPRPRPVACPTR
ncbi:MAG TPA: hypothetical protein VIV11_22020 [Kofleriaceae bacterium]